MNPVEKEVIDQALENCRFWGSTMCKRSTLEKYCREERDIEDPGKVIDELIERGVLYTPKPGYVGFTEPEKWRLEEDSGEDAEASNPLGGLGEDIEKPPIGGDKPFEMEKLLRGKGDEPPLEGVF